MSMQAVIRKGCVSDIKAIQHCAVAAYSQYVERIGRKPAPMVADFAKAVEADQLSVACRNDAVIGFVVFYVVDGGMHLENVAVLPECTGQGVGRVLIEYVEHSARQAQLTSVLLYTNEAMTENLSLYPALGYEEYERRTEQGFRRVYFRKVLS